MAHIDTPQEWLAFITGVGSSIITISIIVGYLYRRVVRPINILINKELTPNGGSSLKDAVGRLEDKLDGTIDLQLQMNITLLEHIRDASKHYKESHDNE